MKFLDLWLLVLLPAAARSEITRVDLVLPPSSDRLQFTQEFLRAPGIIDLSDLKFTAVSDAEADDVFSTSLDVQGSRSSSVVDIVVFTVPSSCTRTDAGCGWTTMGVGVYGGRKTHKDLYCCNEEAIVLKLCHNASFGRLILDKDKFKGQHRFLEIPPGRKSFRDVPVPSGKLSQNKTGWYAIVFANCNDNGRLVTSEGTLVLQNTHGYLPGDYYGLCLFVIGVAATYSSLAVWYAYLMRIHESSPIEKWVLVTVTLGALEMLALIAYYGLWNRSGYRPGVLFYFVMLFRVFQEVLLLSLLVLLSWGWGVIHQSLDRPFLGLVVAGTVYIGVLTARDYIDGIMIQKANTPGLIPDQLLDAEDILNATGHVMGIAYLVWILLAIFRTMRYFKRNGQPQGRRRFFILGCSVLLSLLVTTGGGTLAFSYANNYGTWTFTESIAGVFHIVTEVQYLLLQMTVACLWKPHPSVAVMDVPGTEDHGDENGIEMPVPGGVSVESVGAEPSDSSDSHDRLKVADGQLS
jgi:Lung seven transmembrane receptor